MKTLRAQRAVIKKEIKTLEEEVVKLQQDRSMALMLRGIHQDVDSIKHMVRAMIMNPPKLDAAPRDGSGVETVFRDAGFSEVNAKEVK